MHRLLVAVLILAASASEAGTNWLKQSTAVVIPFGPFVDKTDGVTLETGLVSSLDHGSTGIFLSKNGGTLTIRHATVTASTYDSYGFYKVTLDTTDTNTLGTLDVAFSEAATCLPVWQSYMVVPANIYDSLISGSDVVDVSVTQWLGTAAATPSVAGVPEVDLTHVAGATTDVSALATNTAAILVDTAAQDTADEMQTLVWDSTTVRALTELDEDNTTIDLNASTIGTVTTLTNLPAITTDWITATGIAADAIGASEVAAGAIVKGTEATGWTDLSQADVRSAVGLASANLDTQLAAIVALGLVTTGTADSGTTTTIVDAARTEADTNYWSDQLLCITSGTMAKQCRSILSFVPATDTLTVSPAFTQAVSTETYAIFPGGHSDIGFVDGVALGTHVAGQVPVDVRSWSNTAVASPHTAGYPIVTIKDGIGTGEIDTLSGSVVNVDLTDTLTTYTGNTLQTGDSFARLGAPAGASVSADVAAAKADTAAILTDSNLYDTDAEYATAIWEALTASYGGAGTYGYTLENVSGGSCPTAQQIEDEILNAATSAHTTAGTVGLAIGNAGAAADPNDSLCADYPTEGTIGNTICSGVCATVEADDPETVVGTTIQFTRGDSMVAGGKGVISFTGLSGLSASDTLTVVLEQTVGTVLATYSATYVSATSCTLSLTSAQTTALGSATTTMYYVYRLKQVTSGSLQSTQIRDGKLKVLSAP